MVLHAYTFVGEEVGVGLLCKLEIGNSEIQCLSSCLAGEKMV